MMDGEYNFMYRVLAPAHLLSFLPAWLHARRRAHIRDFFMSRDSYRKVRP